MPINNIYICIKFQIYLYINNLNLNKKQKVTRQTIGMQTVQVRLAHKGTSNNQSITKRNQKQNHKI